MENMQSFQILFPLPALTPYIRYYWILREDAAAVVSERTLPVGCVQLVFHRGKRLFVKDKSFFQPQTFICGQTTGFSDVQSTGEIEMIVVAFQPYAAEALLGIPGHEFCEQTVAMSDVGDKELSDLAEKVTDAPDTGQCMALIEQFFLRRVNATPSYNLKRMSAVIRRINREPQVTVSQLAETACLGNKQLRRIFAGCVGTSPKDFLRIVRMQRALSMLQRDAALPFAQVAYACGFSDQSHMIKEFKLFSGYTPLEYLSVCAPYSDYFSDP